MIEELPTCVRHPGVKTGLSCRLCETPICPECMVSDNIGFQCPSCAGANTQNIRTIGTPKATLTGYIIGLAVGVYVFGELSGFNLVTNFGLAGFAINPLGEYYRFITALFIHGSIMHIVFNMLILHSLGTALEPRLGAKRFALLYFGAGLGGGIASIFVNHPLTFSVGASGAIFGLMGAFIVYAKQYRFDYRQILVLTGINLAIGFIIPGIDWSAHIGGLLTGMAIATVMHNLRN